MISKTAAKAEKKAMYSRLLYIRTLDTPKLEPHGPKTPRVHYFPAGVLSPYFPPCVAPAARVTLAFQHRKRAHVLYVFMNRSSTCLSGGPVWLLLNIHSERQV